MTEEVKEQAPVQEQNQETSIAQSEPVNQETQEQINWRRFREQQAELRRQNEEALRLAKKKEEEAEAFKRAMEALVNKPDPIHQEREETEEDIIAKKVEERLQAREREYQRKREEEEKAQMPNRLKQAYSDFENIVTDENVDYLAYHYPEIHTIFKNMPDSFESWTALYKTLKRFVPNSKDSQKEAKKADENLKKPVSISRGGMSTTPDTNGPVMRLTEERIRANQERMRKILKGV